jgi:hypothetical protein
MEVQMSQAQAHKPVHGGYPSAAHIVAFESAQRSAIPRAVQGGIQPHSIGGLYPMLVVCIDSGDRGRHYELHNLQTGKAAVTYSGYNPLVRKWAGHAGGYDLAHAFAEDVQAGRELTDWA